VFDSIDIRIDTAAWSDAVPDAAVRCRDAVRAALAIAPLPWQDAQVSVLLADNATLRHLNCAYRGRDEATNVLAFAQIDVDPEADSHSPSKGDLFLGDIAVAYETTAGEASEAGKPVADHLCHLIVHGVLHLLGYDHVVDADAEVMEATETRVLAGLGVPNPYEGGMERHG